MTLHPYGINRRVIQTIAGEPPLFAPGIRRAFDGNIGSDEDNETRLGDEAGRVKRVAGFRGF
jgi:hypothetical protein